MPDILILEEENSLEELILFLRPNDTAVLSKSRLQHRVKNEQAYNNQDTK